MDVKKHVTGLFVIFAVLAVAAAGAQGAPPAPPSTPSIDYVIGPMDVLLITSSDQADLSGKFSVEGRRDLHLPDDRPLQGRRVDAPRS